MFNDMPARNEGPTQWCGCLQGVTCGCDEHAPIKQIQIHETSPGDRGVYFDVARDVDCQDCEAVIYEGEWAIYDVDDGLLRGYACGCGPQ